MPTARIAPYCLIRDDTLIEDVYKRQILRFPTSLVTLAASYNNIAYRYEYLNIYEAFIQRPNMSYEGTLPVEKRDDGEYHLTFDHVSYRYPGQSETALKDISFDLELKKHFAIVGRNGAGKTTFIKLMCLLAEPTEGRILLNGIDIRKYALEEYVQIFSVAVSYTHLALDAEGPYYGVRVEPANHMTKGGVVANEKAQVLYEDGTVVKGL